MYYLKKSSTLLAIVLWPFGLLASESNTDGASVFDIADRYTVRIRTVIEYGLGNEAIGASNGTGFVVDAKQGWIVTNRHVVGESPSYVEVSPKDEPYREASKIYVDPYIDIAVIEIEPTASIRQAKLACDQKIIDKGHPVGAYGHPWGFEYTGTQGVISGMTHVHGPESLQTDAPINPGNSGGPLISLTTGEVVGVNAAKISEEGVESLGFAVPIGQVCRIVELLKAGKDPSPPNMNATFFDFEDGDAVVVADSYAAALALGLQPNDEIVAAGPDLLPIDGLHELIGRLRGSLDNVRLRVRRDGTLIEISGALPAWKIRRGVQFAGLVFGPFNFHDVSSMPIGHDIGIQNIVDGSRASAIDIQFWDLIHRVNGTTVKSLEHLYVMLSELDEGSTVTLDLLRPLEDMHFLSPIRRSVPAEAPVWLDNSGAQAGIDVRVAWAETNQASEYQLHRLLRDIHDPDFASPEDERLNLDARVQQLLQSLLKEDQTVAKQ
jgi:S1-C subfamily serine protease